MSFLDSIPLVCVDCGSSLVDSECQACGRAYFPVDGIHNYLSVEDQRSELFQRYLVNYETIARDDMDHDILPPKYKEAQFAKLVGYCGKRIHGTVLDIGAGQGDFLRRVPHDRKIGVDVAPVYLQRLAELGIETIQANAENLPFRDTFDLVVMTDVLEHVLEPERVLRSVVLASKPDALVVVRVPYKEKDLTQYTAEKGCKYEFVHLRAFDEVRLRDCLVNCGLEVSRFRYDGWSMNRLYRGDRGALANLLIWGTKKYYNRRRKRMDAIEADAPFATWPQWLGRQVFEPFELLALARVIKRTPATSSSTPPAGNS